MSTAQSLTALQPFLLLAKSAKGRAAADLVLQATQAPDAYVFSELLTHPNIAALNESDDGKPYYRLLEIFAYGTWGDYQAQASSLPPLTEAHERKLKQLTLLTLCSSGPTHLTYSNLLTQLWLPSIRALEDLVISCIYASLITGKLDTKSSFIEVTACAGRDVSPSDLPVMVSTLAQWLEQCDGVLRDIDEQTRRVKEESVRLKREQDEYDAVVERRKQEMLEDQKNGGFGGGQGGPGGAGVGIKLGKGKRVISDSAGEEGRSQWEEDVDMTYPDDGASGAGWGADANQGRRRAKRLPGSAGSKRR